MNVHDELLKYGTIGSRERLAHDLVLAPGGGSRMDAERILEEAERMSRRLEPDDILLTSAEVATALGLSVRWTETAMRAGRIPGYKVEGHWRCSRSALRAYIRSLDDDV